MTSSIVFAIPSMSTPGSSAYWSTGPPRDHLTGEIEQYDGDDGGIEVDADGVLAGGFELEQRPWFAEAGAAQSTGFADQAGVEEAAHDVGDRLTGQAGRLGQFDAAQLLAAADRVQHHGIVESPDAIEVRPPSNQLDPHPTVATSRNEWCRRPPATRSAWC